MVADALERRTRTVWDENVDRLVAAIDRMTDRPISGEAETAYQLAQAISILRASHYQNCNHGDWSETACPVFVAWDRRRPR